MSIMDLTNNPRAKATQMRNTYGHRAAEVAYQAALAAIDREDFDRAQYWGQVKDWILKDR